MALTKKVPQTLGQSLWCPGCGHGIVIRLIHEILEEKGLVENNINVIGVGCSTSINRLVKGGNKVEAHHGRAPVTARAIKALLPNTCVWTYQGDGDAFSIGMAETILAAQGDYPITVFAINNNVYGMTGGQTAQKGRSRRPRPRVERVYLSM
jgi:2-oxoglutarate ferredoxin oxidoreductase subunit beta